MFAPKYYGYLLYFGLVKPDSEDLAADSPVARVHCISPRRVHSNYMATAL